MRISDWTSDVCSSYLLLAPDRAHDHASGIYAQAPANEVGKQHLALALDVALPALERDDVGGEVGVAVEAQLEVVLDGDEPLLGLDLVDEGPEHRRLAGVDAAADDDVLAGPDRCREVLAEREVDRAEPHEVLEEHLREAVTADGHRRAPGHGHEGEEAAAAGQLHVEARRADVEAAIGEAACRERVWP